MDKTNEELLNQLEAEQAPPVSTPSVNDAVSEIRESSKKSAVDIATTEAKILAEGSDSDFWRIVKKQLNKRVENMRAAQSGRLSAGPINLQDVGLRSLIINEIADAFTDLINVVEQVRIKQDIPDDRDPEEDIVGTE